MLQSLIEKFVFVCLASSVQKSLHYKNPACVFTQQGSCFRYYNIRREECVQKISVSHHGFGGFLVCKSLKLMLTLTPFVAQQGKMGKR